jgi:predicted transcriptional regulator
MLRILETKGHTRHEQEGPRYVYVPTLARNKAKRSALKHLLNTFFEGSAEQVVAALLDVSGDELSDADFSRLRRLIDSARDEARQERDGQ